VGEEPVLPPIPAIGDNVLSKKRDKLIVKEYTIIKCIECKSENKRRFEVGDFVFKRITNKNCTQCNKKNSLIISEIFSEWIDPKKEK